VFVLHGVVCSLSEKVGGAPSLAAFWVDVISEMQNLITGANLTAPGCEDLPQCQSWQKKMPPLSRTPWVTGFQASICSSV
jgi:hypothetical protein